MSVCQSCDRPPEEIKRLRRGMCSACYQRWRYHRDRPEAEYNPRWPADHRCFTCGGENSPGQRWRRGECNACGQRRLRAGRRSQRSANAGLR